MKKVCILIGLMILMPSVLTAQQWESMDGPYFVYNVTGMSIGWTDYGGPNQTAYAYAVGSDLDDNFIYGFSGDTPIESWSLRERIPGAKHVSASRYNGLRAYATVPEGAGIEEGVHYTFNGGLSWSYNSFNQPGAKDFTDIEAHPNNEQICFTTAMGNQLGAIWRTLDGGGTWTHIGENGPFEWRESFNAIHIDPNSPADIQSTTVYLSYVHEGNFKSTDGGETWIGLPIPDRPFYEGIDIVVKEGDSDNLYALIQFNSVYELWHSVDGGSSWGSEPEVSFGSNSVYKVIVEDYDYQGEHQDAVWVIGDNSVFTHVVGQYPGWTIFPIGHTPFMSGFVDPTAQWFGGEFIPGGLLHIGSELTMQQAFYDVGGGDITFSTEEVISGTNVADVASLDCIEGRSLRCVTKDGGYIRKNRDIYDQYGIGWEWDNVFIGLTSLDVEGKKLSCYYSDGTDSYIAYALDGTEPYLIENGHEVNWDREAPDRPALFNVVQGRHYDIPYWQIVFAGGIQFGSNNNVVWKSSSNPLYSLSEEHNLGGSPPVISDILHEKVHEDHYYACGSRNSDIDDIVVYLHVNNPSEIAMNQGLTGVLNAHTIVKSKEIFEGTQQDGLSTLYLGTEQGIFKNKYDFSSVLPWYSSDYGIPQGMRIEDIVNFYHIIENGGGDPDSIVQYALGLDAFDNPFIYVTADSGRSWVEMGGYFRDQNIQVNELVTFTDRRSEYEPNPYFLGVGTNNGVYRYRFNVRSGILAGSEDWDGLIIVNGDVTVPTGATLTIQPGTEILFTYDFDRVESGADIAKSELIVSGTLNAIGTPGDQITFASSEPYNPSAGDWYGIRAYAGSNINLSDCVIKHAKYGISATYASSLIVESCTIEDNLTAGIFLDNAPSGTMITNSRIENSGTYGIYCFEGTFTALADTIVDNRYGINYIGDHAFTVQNCVVSFSDPMATSYYGIRAVNYLTPTNLAPIVVGDSITGFSQGGIYFDDVTNSSAKIEATSVYNSGKSGIYYYRSSARIDGGLSERNLLKENDYGLILYSSSSPTVRRTKFENNDKAGASISGGGSPDFGTELEWGNNSFLMQGAINPVYRHLINNSLLTINAIYNYWDPLDKNLIVNAFYKPYLRNDPLPKVILDWDNAMLADDFELAGAYPNPFNASTRISFNLSSPQFVTVKIYNIMGQEVNTIFEGYGSSGENTIVWNGENQFGNAVSTGVYLVQMRSAEKQKTLKMTMLK